MADFNGESGSKPIMKPKCNLLMIRDVNSLSGWCSSCSFQTSRFMCVGFPCNSGGSNVLSGCMSVKEASLLSCCVYRYFISSAARPVAGCSKTRDGSGN